MNGAQYCMTTNPQKRSRRNVNKVGDRIRSNLWLAVPLGFIIAVAAIGLTRGQEEKVGLVRQLNIDSAGIPLPPRAENAELPGTPYPDLGQEHVPDGTQVDYNSNPPTSGPHYSTPALAGIYNEAPPDEQLVHNLEHGYIIISYHPEQVSEDVLEQIRQQVLELSATNPRLILTPRASLDVPIALTAWGYLQELDSYEPEVVQAFYDAHVARAPECSEGLCPP